MQNVQGREPSGLELRTTLGSSWNVLNGRVMVLGVRMAEQSKVTVSPWGVGSNPHFWQTYLLAADSIYSLQLSGTLTQQGSNSMGSRGLMHSESDL